MSGAMRTQFPTPRCRRCKRLVDSFNVHLDVPERAYRFVITCHGETVDLVLKHQSISLPANQGGPAEEFFEALPEEPAHGEQTMP